MSSEKPSAARTARALLVGALALSMLLGFASPVFGASSQSSGVSGVITHYQVGKAPVITTVSQRQSAPARKSTILATDQTYPQPMSVSGGYVYWYAIGLGELNRVSQSGGKVQTLATVSSTDSSGYGLAVEGHYVFWEYVAYSNLTFYMFRTDISTGKTKALFTGSSDLILGSFAVNGGSIYFIYNGDILKMNTDGTHTVTLAADPSECPLQDTYSSGYVYWLDACSGQVGSVPATGGSPKLLSPSLSSGGESYNGILQLAVSGAHIYWTFNGQTNSSTDTVSTSGSGFKMLYSDSGTSEVFGGVAYSHGKVLFADPSTSVVYSVPSGGGALKTFLNYPASNLEVSGSTLFFTSSADSTVGKTPS